MTARDYLWECYRLTGIVLVDTIAAAAKTSVDTHAREMALTYRALGYGTRAAADFLKTYYLMESSGG